jgi:hypothetical protein
MYRRTLIVTTGALFLLLTTTYLFSLEPLSSVVEQQSPLMRSVPLQVTLSKESWVANSDLGSVTIHVTLTNLSPNPIYLLLWSSPLDPRAIVTGTLKFVSPETNQSAPCLDIKINRKLPESGYFSIEDEEIITIPAEGTAQRFLEAREPEVALTKGEKYWVRARGNWMGVWTQGKEGQHVERLALEDGLSGEFESNVIEIEMPADEGGEL